MCRTNFDGWRKEWINVEKIRHIVFISTMAYTMTSVMINCKERADKGPLLICRRPEVGKRNHTTRVTVCRLLSRSQREYFQTVLPAFVASIVAAELTTSKNSTATIFMMALMGLMKSYTRFSTPLIMNRKVSLRSHIHFLIVMLKGGFTIVAIIFFVLISFLVYDSAVQRPVLGETLNYWILADFSSFNIA